MMSNTYTIPPEGPGQEDFKLFLGELESNGRLAFDLRGVNETWATASVDRESALKIVRHLQPAFGCCGDWPHDREDKEMTESDAEAQEGYFEPAAQPTTVIVNVFV